MRKLALALVAFSLAGCATSRDATEAMAGISDPGHVYDVYFLGGQSNMEGFGYVSELPAELRGPVENVRIFHGRTVADGEEGGGAGYWTALRPGHGFEFDTDGDNNRLSDRFGPELTFGKAIAAASQNRIALIKYTRGGTALVDGVSGFGSWDPDYATGNARNQYDNALTAVGEALADRDVDGDGHIDRLVPAGIVWMQGEADAFDNKAASADYARNLARIVELFRAALHNDNLPVVIGRIKDSGNTAETQVMAYSSQVRAAQGKFVAADRCAMLVTESDGFSFLPDGWHYTSKDYITLGNAFADAMIQLKDHCR